MAPSSSESSPKDDQANTDVEGIDTKLAELSLGVFSQRVLTPPEIRSLAIELLLMAEKAGHLDEA